MAAIKDELITLFAKFSTAPFLFVGSGISRRYLNLESWDDLLDKFSKQTSKEYLYYKSKANENLPQTATLLSKEYGELWWNDSKFSEEREKYKRECKSEDSPLKIAISKYIQGISKEANWVKQYQHEIASLKKAIVDGIITTNWDIFLEEIFKDYVPYIGQQDIFFGPQQIQGLAEIYKIHGCCTNANSLVLTTSDYQTYNEKNSYLVAKLLTVFVEHPIVFIGYSMNDPNILEILKGITLCLDQDKIDKLQDRFIFVQWKSGSIGKITKTLISPSQGKSFPMTVIELESFLPLYEALGQYERKIPIKLLRQLKEQIYNLVLTNSPEKDLYVLDLAKTKGLPIEVAIAVGSVDKIHDRGWTTYNRTDLCYDLVFPGKGMSAEPGYDPKKLLKNVYPQLQADYVPIFKYIREAGYDDIEKLKNHNFGDKVRTVLKHKQSHFRASKNYKGNIGKEHTLKTLYAAKGIKGVMYSAAYLSADSIDLDFLLKILQENYTSVSESSLKPYFCKLICLYDFLKFGFSAKPSPLQAAEILKKASSSQ